MNTTFGAPFLARSGSGHAGDDSSNVRPITPENALPGLYSFSATRLLLRAGSIAGDTRRAASRSSGEHTRCHSHRARDLREMLAELPISKRKIKSRSDISEASAYRAC